MKWERVRAAEITKLYWDSQRAPMIDWLINIRRFNPEGAVKCADNFIETMVFVAEETGEPQFRN